MAITIPSTAQTAGIPAQWEDTITAAEVALITGDEPRVVTEDLLVAASQTLAALTVVGFDGSGNLVPAVLGTTAAIGILVVGITTPGSGALKAAPVYRAGVFNPGALVWDATYDTELKKLNAFHGAPTPTNIIMRRPKTATV